MADTQRSATEMATILVDNTTLQIVPQDLRDFKESVPFRDGSLGFTDVVAGVTPTADAHLSTKAYVDARKPRIGGINLTASATTLLTQGVWTATAGTFAANVLNDSEWTLAPSGAGLVWGGAACNATVVAQCSYTNGSNGDKIALGVAVDGTVIGDHGHVTVDANGDSHNSVTQIVALTNGAVVSLMTLNHTDNSDIDVNHLTAVMTAYP